MKAQRGSFADCMATVGFGIQVVECAIAKRHWADARHYLRATRSELARAEAAAANLEARTLKPLPLRSEKAVAR